MTGVLHGVRVIDLSWGIAGPMAAMLLADHGADVVKVEPPGGDPFRSLQGYKVWQRGKRSAVLDLASDEGREDLLRLLADADVVAESYAPGTLEKLGLGVPALLARFPRLIALSITPYGRDTKYAG